MSEKKINEGVPSLKVSRGNAPTFQCYFVEHPSIKGNVKTMVQLSVKNYSFSTQKLVLIALATDGQNGIGLHVENIGQFCPILLICIRTEIAINGFWFVLKALRAVLIYVVQFDQNKANSP